MDSHRVLDLPPTQDSYRELLSLVSKIFSPLGVTSATIRTPTKLASFFAKEVVNSIRNQEFLDTLIANPMTLNLSVELPYSYLNKIDVGGVSVRQKLIDKIGGKIPESGDLNATYACSISLYDTANADTIENTIQKIQDLAQQNSSALQSLVQKIKDQERAKDLETSTEYAGYRVGEPFTQSALHRRERTMAHEGKTYGTENEDDYANGSIVAVLDGVGSGGKHSGILARAMAEGLGSMETNFTDVESAREAITNKIIEIRRQYYKDYKDDNESEANADKIATTIAAIVNIAGVPHILYVGDSKVIKFSTDRNYRLSPVDSEGGKLTNTLSLSTFTPQLSFIRLYQEWEKPPEFVLLTTDWIDVLPDSYGNDATSGVGKKPFLEAVQQMVKSGRSRLDIEKYIKSVIEKGVYDDATFILMQQDPKTELSIPSDVERGKAVFEKFLTDNLQKVCMQQVDSKDEALEHIGIDFDRRFDFPKLEDQVERMLKYVYAIAKYIPNTKLGQNKEEDFKTLVSFLWFYGMDHNDDKDLNKAVHFILGKELFERVFKAEGDSLTLNIELKQKPFSNFSWEIIELIQKLKLYQPEWFDGFVNNRSASLYQLGGIFNHEEIPGLGKNFTQTVESYEADNNLEGVKDILLEITETFIQNIDLPNLQSAQQFNSNCFNSNSVGGNFEMLKVDMNKRFLPSITNEQKQDKRYLAVVSFTHILKMYLSQVESVQQESIIQDLQVKFELEDLQIQWLFSDEINYGVKTREQIYKKLNDGLNRLGSENVNVQKWVKIVREFDD